MQNIDPLSQDSGDISPKAIKKRTKGQSPAVE